MTLDSDQIDLAHEQALALGAAVIRPATREVVFGDVVEILEPRVMQVLVALARRRGEVVSRDDLITSCWGGRAVGDDAINRCIARIRRLSEVHGGFSLETIARVGYRLAEQAPKAAFATGAAGSAKSFPPLKFSSIRLGTIVIAILFAIAALFVSRLPSTNAPTKTLMVRAPAKLTIAVLPFTPLYPDADAQRLADSIALRLSDTLASTAFDVISPDKSLQYRGAAKANAAQALGADFLIDGDIRRENGTLDIALRIIDGHSGTTIVAGTVKRPVAEADSAPDEIASEMAAFATVTDGLKNSWGRDPRVVAAYFRAIYQFGARGEPYEANETAREAARIAPDNALAQGLHGFMAANLVAWLPAADRTAMVAEARDAAGRALRLDPGYGDAYSVFALTTPNFDWAVREGFLRRGLAIYPDASAARTQLIELFQNAGRFRESEPFGMAMYAQGRSPTMQPLVEMINAELWSGQVKEAAALLAHARKRFPTSPWFAAKTFEATALHGAPAEAQTLLRDASFAGALEPGGSPMTFTRMAAALRDHRAADVDAVVDECLSPEGRSAEIKRTCLMVLVALGRLDDAFRLAEILYPDQRGATQEQRESRWPTGSVTPTAYLSIPVTAPLRADPRFPDLVARVGLLQYWQSSHRPPDFCGAEKVPVCALLKAGSEGGAAAVPAPSKRKSAL